MWLLHTTTLTLRFFADPEGLYYAILSHTWGDEEITFQEMNASAGPDKRKKGWRKIAETCRLARNEHQLEYAWVDTCCIDKSSSAELSEAINSMFDWYKGSSLCFVFLEDVRFSHRFGAVLAPRPGTPEFQDRLRTARWFSRGWTLQELVAPRYILFYDAMGNALGTKNTLADDLVEITNIDRAVLEDVGRLHMVPVARKMSWAAPRHTTRVEDVAYCLLGMFDVSMPLLYGEGTRAFLRLQEEIARSGSDWSLLAWSLPRSNSWPHLRNQICGVFAPSPAEFWNGHNLRLPGWALEQNFELSLADRGFLRINRNIYTYENDRARLILDCLIKDSPPSSRTAWLEVELEKIGSFYARADLGATALVKTTSRARGNLGPERAWLKEPVSVATAIPQALIEAYRIRPPPCQLFYTPSLTKHVGAAQGVEHFGLLTMPLQSLPPRDIPLDGPYGNIKASATVSGQDLGDTFFPVKGGVFSTTGILGSRHHHLFEFHSVPVALVWCQELAITGRYRREMSPPWAVLLCPHTVAETGAELHPDVFRRSSSGASMSEEERSRLLHDFVFQWYSDDTGGYRKEDIPTSVRLQGDDQNIHEIKVQAALGLSISLVLSDSSDFHSDSEKLFFLVLSHRRIPVEKLVAEIFMSGIDD